MNSTFDRKDLTRRLAPLPVGPWIAFATACAQRLLPIFEAGAKDWGWQRRADDFRALLQACWTLAHDPGDEAVRARVKAADYEALVRGGDIDDPRAYSSGYRLFVYPPISVLEVALDCAHDQTLERATYAAEKEYDSVCSITDWGLPVRQGPMSLEEARAAEKERLEQQHQHPLVQISIRLQLESIDLLAEPRGLDKGFVQSFREKTDVDGQLLLKLAMEIYPRRQ